MDFWATIATDIAAHSGHAYDIKSRQPVSGGSINSAYKISNGSKVYFVKTNRAQLLGMFEAEAAGLGEIAKSCAIRVPQPLCVGVAQSKSYLVLEYVEFSLSRSDPAALGRKLASMHRITADKYGWVRDNTIGSTPQPNTQGVDWVLFWQEQRLGFQLGLARDKGYGHTLLEQGEKLCDRMPVLFESYTPAASLLHGDLWSGNYSYDALGSPVIFDPAVYYGDRESDLAMTELFGGFPAQFYASYKEAYAVEPGYETRKILYNLYHILNHLNLFGTGYLGQSLDMIDRLLAEC